MNREIGTNNKTYQYSIYNDHTDELICEGECPLGQPIPIPDYLEGIDYWVEVWRIDEHGMPRSLDDFDLESGLVEENYCDVNWGDASQYTLTKG